MSDPKDELRDLKRAISGQIRNVLANEYGFRPNQQIIPNKVHDAALERLTQDQNFIDRLATSIVKRIEPKIEASVNREVAKIIAGAFQAQVAAALGEFRFTITHEPPEKVDGFGRF
jgi:hypothetical protein